MKNFFTRLFSKPQSSNKGNEQAVLIHLNGTDLPAEVYKNYDLATLEDQLQEALQAKGIGEVDGNETGPQETTIFIYGANAEMIFSEIASILQTYPLCQKARVVIRYGKPGSPQKEVRI